MIPAFNAEQYLGEAIRSALGQSLAPLEVVVVDDGSTDSTREVAEGFGGRVRVFSGVNAGPSAARNRGVAEARSTWIAFLDADDRWELDYLKAADAYLEAHVGVGLLCLGVRVLEDDRPTAHVIHKKTAGPAYTTVGLLEGDVGTICTPLVRRDLFLASGGFDETLRANEDCHLWLRLSRVTQVHQTPEPFLLYRRHAQNASGDLLANARESVRSLEKLEETHPEFGREFRRPMNRMLGKEYLRLGRELLVRGEDLPAARARAPRGRHAPAGAAPRVGLLRVRAGARRRAPRRGLQAARARGAPKWRTSPAAAAIRRLRRRLRGAHA